MEKIYPIPSVSSVPKGLKNISKNALVAWNDPRAVHSIPLREAEAPGMFRLHECGYLQDCAEWNYDGLASPFWRLYHNGKKGAAILSRGERIPLSADEVVIIPENVPFDSRGRAGVPHLWIHFDPPFAPKPAERILTAPFRGLLAEGIRELREFQVRGAESEPGGAGRLAHLCLVVLHAWLAEAPIEDWAPLPARHARVIESIDRGLGGDLSNSSLARIAGMSVEGLIRSFGQWSGTTPARYVAGRRIREACRLLALGEISIEEIAEKLGFANRHHFTRVFAKYTRKTPAKFRKEQQLLGDLSAQKHSFRFPEVPFVGQRRPPFAASPRRKNF